MKAKGFYKCDQPDREGFTITIDDDLDEYAKFSCVSLDLSLAATQDLHEWLDRRLAWTRHPLYKWGRRKIGAML